MSTDEIKTFLVKNKILENPSVTLLGQGESNINYLAENGNAKFVVRVQRKDVPGHNRFETESHYMNFVNGIGIDFAPKTILYDKVQDIHIISYVEGRDASIIDLSDAELEIFIKQLKVLNEISFDDYSNWCGKNNYDARVPMTLETRNKLYVVDKLSNIRNFITDDSLAQSVIEWAEPKVEVLKDLAKSVPQKTIFLHDDLRWNDGGGNLKISGDKLFFIDWELCGFYEGELLEIGDILGSISSTSHDKSISKRLYEAYIKGEANVENINNSIIYTVLWAKLGNTLWAAERYFTFNKSNHKDTGRYKNLTELGMKDTEYFYESPFKMWFQ